jgi:GTP cyclohydrolase IA
MTVKSSYPSPLEAIAEHVRDILDHLGYETSSEHLKDTPKRVARLWYDQLAVAAKFSRDASFTTFANAENLSEMVVIGDIDFHSTCAHHVLPFIGKAHIAYIPHERIAGLSKFARVVCSMAKGLWVQESLTWAIANELETRLQPLGLAVVLQAEHLCMSLRGIQKPGHMTTTSDMRGAFIAEGNNARAEFLALINHRR